MNKFNLTFWGEILPGKDPQQVKRRFAKLFGIDDPKRVEHFFSGDTIILRRNLDRKVAGEYFHKLHKLGVEAELIKVVPSTETPPALEPAPNITSKTDSSESQWETARRQAELESLNRHKQEQQKKAEEQDRQRAAKEENEKERQAAEEARLKVEQAAEAERKRIATAEAKRLREEEAARLRAQAEKEKQRQTEAAERKRIAAAEAKRLREEEAARLRAQAEKEKQRKAEEAERKRIAAAEAKRLREEEAARLRAQAEKEKQRKAEEAERKRIAAAEAKRLREEEAARLRAQAEKEKQRKAEEAERKRIAAAEAKRLREEEAARLRAQAEKEKQRKAEEAERKRIAAAEAKRLREEEAERKKAKAALERQRKAEEAAKKKAATEEARRRKAEAIARKKAEDAEEKRRLAEEQAILKAAQEVERKQREAEAALIAAEKAKLDQQKAEDAARQKAQQVTQERRRRELERKNKAAEEALRRQRLEEEKRKARETEEKVKTEQQQQRLREQKEVEERERELEEKAIERGAKALSGTPNLKTTQAKVKSRLELPRKNTAYHSGGGKHQTGAPNLYQLKPFRNRAEVRERPSLAKEKARKGILIGAAALAVLLLILGRFASLTAQPALSGPTGIAASNKGELLIIAGDTLLIHDRAGVASDSITANDLGLKALAAPVSYTPSGKVLLQASSQNDSNDRFTPWLCDLTQKACTPLATEHGVNRFSSLRVHDLNGDLFIADGAAGQLLKLSANGDLKSAADRPLPNKPVIRLNSGLLFINSKEGPAISVLRYEDQAFGQQLDEVLLLPPPALEREHTRVWDFANSGNYWWVTLFNPGNGDSALYLFDSDWSYVRQLSRDEMSHPGQLVNWGRKVLLFSQHQPNVLRYGEAGAEEAALQSTLLEEMIDQRANKRQLVDLAWHLSILLSLVIAMAGFAYAYLYSIRALVYKNRPTRGADPLDDIADQIQWIELASTRSEQLRHASIACAVLGLAMLVTLIGLGVSAMQLAAAMLALCGPFTALQLILRNEPEHLGLRNEQLVLVDHRQMYHLASGPRIHHRGPFVMIDDVVIFTGTVLLPAFDRSQFNSLVKPLIQAGVRVDRKTVLVKLMESHHPVARAIQITTLSLLAGLILVALGQLPW